MEEPVLVLTARDDVTADLVVHELNNRGVPVARFDPADFPADAALAASIEDSRWTGWLSTVGERTVDIASVRSVYYRRPGRPAFPNAMSDSAVEWSMREAIHGLLGVLASLDCLYVNHPAMNHAAEFKARQLAVATLCGLDTPATLVTNDVVAARRFADRHATVLKPLRGGAIVDDGVHKAAYTHTVRPDDIDDSVRLTAHLLQAHVEKTHDVRVTVVGDQMFAASIHAGSDAARLDFRADYRNLSYERVDVPELVRDGVNALVRRLGLVFAALDFAVDHTGRWIFLGDVNPNGQWAWVEANVPELRITAAIADTLEKGLV